MKGQCNDNFRIQAIPVLRRYCSVVNITEAQSIKKSDDVMLLSSAVQFWITEMNICNCSDFYNISKSVNFFICNTLPIRNSHLESTFFVDPFLLISVVLVMLLKISVVPVMVVKNPNLFFFMYPWRQILLHGTQELVCSMPFYTFYMFYTFKPLLKSKSNTRNFS